MLAHIAVRTSPPALGLLGPLRPPRAPQAANAHAGSVKSFSAPSAPSPPQLPTDLAAELSAFDAAEPQFAAPASAKKDTTGASEGQGEGVKEYIEFLERDLPKADAHH